MAYTFGNVNVQARDPNTGDMESFGLLGSESISGITAAKNAAVAAIGEMVNELLAPPETDGSYLLKVVVDGSTITYSWVAESQYLNT